MAIYSLYLHGMYVVLSVMFELKVPAANIVARKICTNANLRPKVHLLKIMA